MLRFTDASWARRTSDRDCRVCLERRVPIPEQLLLQIELPDEKGNPDALQQPLLHALVYCSNYYYS